MSPADGGVQDSLRLSVYIYVSRHGELISANKHSTVLGGICLLAFPLWEMSTRLSPTPIVSFTLFKNRTVVCGCILGFFYFMAFFLSVQPYFYSYLVVALNLSVITAGHIVQIFSFACTVTVVALG